MKKFMMIFLGPNYEDAGLSPEQMQAQMGKWFAWDAKMKAAGIVDHGDALTPQVQRISGKDRTVTDVAATELKELVGGYYIINAESFEEAAKVAQDYPDYDHGGTVEIREVMVYDQ